MALMWWWSNIKSETFLELVDKRLLTYKDISQRIHKIKMREEMVKIYTQHTHILWMGNDTKNHASQYTETNS